jgi:hypothetical protein
MVGRVITTSPTMGGGGVALGTARTLTFMDIALAPTSSTRADGDARWREEVTALRRSVADVGPVRIETEAVPGQKGVVETFIIVLGSAKLIPQFVQLLRVWLERDRHRSVTVTWKSGESTSSVTVDGGSMSDDTLQAALVAAIGEHED